MLVEVSSRGRAVTFIVAVPEYIISVRANQTSEGGVSLRATNASEFLPTNTPPKHRTIEDSTIGPKYSGEIDAHAIH